MAIKIFIYVPCQSIHKNRQSEFHSRSLINLKVHCRLITWTIDSGHLKFLSVYVCICGKLTVKKSFSFFFDVISDFYSIRQHLSLKSFITVWNLPALPIISQRPRTVRELRVVRFHHCSAAMILKMGKLLTYRIGPIQHYQSWPPGLLCENPIKTY